MVGRGETPSVSIATLFSLQSRRSSIVDVVFRQTYTNAVSGIPFPGAATCRRHLSIFSSERMSRFFHPLYSSVVYPILFSSFPTVLDAALRKLFLFDCSCSCSRSVWTVIPTYTGSVVCCKVIPFHTESSVDISVL